MCVRSSVPKDLTRSRALPGLGSANGILSSRREAPKRHLPTAYPLALGCGRSTRMLAIHGAGASRPDDSFKIGQRAAATVFRGRTHEETPGALEIGRASCRERV